MTNKVNFEIIFVDNISKNNALKVIKDLSQKDNNIKYIPFSKNFKKEVAIFAGLEKTKSDFVAIMDVDLQDSPELLIDIYIYKAIVR